MENNFFLLNESINLESFEDFMVGMSELNLIEKQSKDSFFKHDSVWSLKVVIELYDNSNFAKIAIIKFIGELLSTENYLSGEILFDELFPDGNNGFLGINFSNTEITLPKQIINQDTFQKFKHDNLWDITFRDLWSKREELFPNLILCGQVEQQISRIGNSSQFNQIVERLKTFNEAVGEWADGDFSYRNINDNYALRISPESEQTMSRFGNERIFSLPTGGTEVFELHIKTGDFRFHFYPDNDTKETYVGYIGSHLNTVSN